MENRNCNKTERDVLAKGINPEGYSVESDLAVLNENLRNFQKRRVISLGLRRSPAKSADRMSASVEWNRLRSSQDGIIESGRKLQSQGQFFDGSHRDLVSFNAPA